MIHLSKLLVTASLSLPLWTLADTLNTCPATDPLTAINCDFHQAYMNRTDAMMQTLGATDGHPVILNLGGKLVFMHHGQSETVNAAPEAFHAIKTFAHALFATDLLLQHIEDGLLPTEAKDKLITLQSHIIQSVKEIDNLPLLPEEKMLIKNLTQQHLEYINQLITTNLFKQAELKHFFNTHRAELEKVIKLDAVLQLAILDKTINRWLDSLTPSEQEKLGVVVATVHQARAKELSLLYFMKKFHFKYGEGAQFERNFVVLEGRFDKESALKLLARHYLDREAAAMIFDDSERLQSDVLGPAASDILT